MQNATSLPGPDDRSGRKSVRRRTLFSGKLVYGNHDYSFNCAIKDLSPDGARLRLPQKQYMPAQGHLIDSHGRTAYAFRLVWMKPPHAGIAFTQAWSLDGDLPASLAGLRRIWLAIAPC
jgi:hypothetical protein